jgi:hypothetical protein
MRRLFKEISDPERVAALSKAIGAWEQHGFPWNDRYIATPERGHKVDVRLAGVAGDLVHGPYQDGDLDRENKRPAPAATGSKRGIYPYAF